MKSRIKEYSMVGKMTEWIKHLLCTHEDPDARHPCYCKADAWLVPVCSALEAVTGNPWSKLASNISPIGMF